MNDYCSVVNIIPFDWYSKKECSLDDIKEEVLCFSFKKGKRLFVYVKQEKKEEKLEK